MIEQPLMSFLIGFKHSLEADHIATVFSIKGSNKLKGLIWAIGHSFSILLLSSLMYFLNFRINENLFATVELFIGCLLVFMSFKFFLKVLEGQDHIQQHQHNSTIKHIHYHPEGDHPDEWLGSSPPGHTHALTLQTFLIGILHGIAGTGGFIILTSMYVTSDLGFVIFLGMFILGSLMSMSMTFWFYNFLRTIYLVKIEKYISYVIVVTASYIGIDKIIEVIF
tara:strand:- start:251 stop:919 length:669 start_codon:yes stop_codon:yes gene_type:complete